MDAGGVAEYHVRGYQRDNHHIQQRVIRHAAVAADTGEAAWQLAPRRAGMLRIANAPSVNWVRRAQQSPV